MTTIVTDEEKKTNLMNPVVLEKKVIDEINANPELRRKLIKICYDEKVVVSNHLRKIRDNCEKYLNILFEKGYSFTQVNEYAREIFLNIHACNVDKKESITKFFLVKNISPALLGSDNSQRDGPAHNIVRYNFARAVLILNDNLLADNINITPDVIEETGNVGQFFWYYLSIFFKKCYDHISEKNTPK